MQISKKNNFWLEDLIYNLQTIEMDNLDRLPVKVDGKFITSIEINQGEVNIKTV